LKARKFEEPLSDTRKTGHGFDGYSNQHDTDGHFAKRFKKGKDHHAI